MMLLPLGFLVLFRKSESDLKDPFFLVLAPQEWEGAKDLYDHGKAGGMGVVFTSGTSRYFACFLSRSFK